MIPPQIIVAGILITASAATGFGAAWKIQSWRSDAKEKQHAEQELADERLGTAAQVRRLDTAILAQNAATVRAVALRNDAAASRLALVGLHDATEQALRDAATSNAACTKRAATLAELFAASATGYRELAAKADRHASDVRTLIEAWPR